MCWTQTVDVHKRLYVIICGLNAVKINTCALNKAVNRGDKRTRRVRDRVFVKFERSRHYRDRYRCQEKKSRRSRARDLVFRDPPMPRTSPRSLFAARDSPPPHGLRLKPWI